MNIDADLRELAANTRAVVASGVDEDVGATELRQTHRRRRQVSIVAGLAVATLMVATFGALHSPGSAPREASVAAGPEADLDADPAAEWPRPETCHPQPGIRCLDEGLVLIEASTPYTLQVGPGFSIEPRTRGAEAIDVYQDRRDTAAGATLLARVQPATGRDRTLTAKALATWVAARPFVGASEVEAGIHDGLRSYSVEVYLADPSGRSSRPLLTQPGGGKSSETGLRDTMLSRYEFIDVPGLGVVALWSWAMHGNVAALDRNAQVLDTVDFELPASVYRNAT